MKCRFAAYSQRVFDILEDNRLLVREMQEAPGVLREAQGGHQEALGGLQDTPGGHQEFTKTSLEDSLGKNPRKNVYLEDSCCKDHPNNN